MGERIGEDALTRLIARGDGVDAVEEHRALAQVQSELFAAPFSPTALARYVLLERLGAGGGGVVYRGYDPDLHRKVAIKLLRVGDGSEGAGSAERLLREAQAIARLNHPNVVTVHDVGTVEDSAVGEGVFVVMELIEGRDLRAWLQQSHTRDEVLEVLIGAGRGLAAAHAQGIVHRDFKPANVLVGDDGRVRVLDFGLARAAGLAEVDRVVDPELSMSASPALLDHELTDAGTVMGTPAYMAPEQHDGSAADARADQYAFCVTLYEALHGHRPFAGKTLDTLLEAKRGGPPRGGSNDGVPRWLEDVIARGLAPVPGDRFDDVPQLLAALERDPLRRRRRLFGLAGAVTVAAALVYGGIETRGRGDQRCKEAPARLGGIWDDALRGRARASFRESGAAYAEEVWAKVESALDRHATAWVDASTRACEATLVHGEQAPEEMALKVLCLDRQLAELSHVTRLIASADERVVRSAPAMVARLPDPRRCDHAARELGERIDLRGPEREAVLALDTSLLQAEVLNGSGRYDEAATILADVVTRADVLGDVRSRSRARLLECAGLWLRNRFEAAERACEDALAAAEQGGSDALAIDALIGLGRVEAAMDVRDAADRVFRIAAARIAAVPDAQRDPLQEARLAVAVGHLRGDQGRRDEGVRELERGREIFEGELGPDHPDLLSVINGLGLIARGQGRPARARAHYERAIELASGAYGPRHPLIGSLYNNIGAAELDAGNPQRAITELERALELKTEGLGPRSPRLVTTLYMLGDALAAVGRHAEALSNHRQALALHEEAHGAQHRMIAPSLRRVGQTLRRMGRCEQAMEYLQRAKALHEPDPDADPFGTAAVRYDLARCHVAAGRHGAARAELEDALEIIRSTQGREASANVEPLYERGLLELEAGDDAAARSYLERALTLQGDGEDFPHRRAAIEFALARTLVASDPGRAHALASAAEGFVAGHGWTPEDLHGLDAWLKEHAT